MREIASVFIGQAGVQVGATCLELICAEHRLAPDGSPLPLARESHRSVSVSNASASLSTFFEESSDAPGQYRPRSFFADCDAATVSNVWAKFGGLVAADQCSSSNGDTGGCWARAVSSGQAVTQATVAAVRKQLEVADRAQAVMVLHSLGGGTGSGIGSSVLTQLRDDVLAPATPIVSLSLWPAEGFAGPPAEAYNATLGLSGLRDHTVLSLVMDNQQLAMLTKKQNEFKSLNTWVAQTVSSWTAPLRFPGALNLDIAELATNMVPFPGLHFVLSSHAMSAGCGAKGAGELTRAVVQTKNLSATTDNNDSTTVVCSLIFSGDFSCTEINRSLEGLRAKDNNTAGDALRFVDWCPTSYKTALSQRPPHIGLETQDRCEFLDADQLAAWRSAKRTVCGVVNTTAVGDVFRRVADRFDALRAKGTYAHWFEAEGCSITDMDEARERLGELIKDYEQAGTGVNGRVSTPCTATTTNNSIESENSLLFY